MSLVCVLVLFRVSVCACRVSELLVVRLSFVVKLFRLRCVSCEIPKFSCRVLNSSFSFEFVVEFRIRISRFVAPFDFSIFVSCFEFELVVEISRRNFRCLALFDFSNLALNSSSNSTSRISLLYSTSRISI